MIVGFVPMTQAVPTIEIVMEQTTYSYCEKLFYTIKVSEITGDLAIIHIRDSVGKSSSAIPIGITNYENPVPSRAAFIEDVFPLGDYFIDVEYSGQKTSETFTLIDSGKKCFPEFLKTITVSWIAGNISDGMLVDAFERYSDVGILDIPFEVSEQNINGVQIPQWVKNAAVWWVQEDITDMEFAAALEYMMNNDIITVQS